MRDDVSQLLVLQNLDQEILKLENELRLIPQEKERAAGRLMGDKNALAARKAATQENEIAIKKVELDIATRKQTLERLRKQQFETRKNEEYKAIEHEIGNYLGQIDELETRELELLEKSDQLQADVELAKQSLDKTQTVVDEDLRTLDQRAKSRQDRLTELQTKRASRAASTDADLLSLYERLFKVKDALALCQVNDAHQCEGCHMKVTSATYILAQSEKELAQCDNCGRIIHTG